MDQRQFTFIETDDGSPTLRILNSHSIDQTPCSTSPHLQSSEAMHSLRGAFAETCYIYGSAIEYCLLNDFPPKILSLGLGLGYVEILSAGLILKHVDRMESHIQKTFMEQVRGLSFELVPQLRQWFVDWLNDSESCPVEFKLAYNDILTRTSLHVDFEATKIKIFLKQLITSQAWEIQAALGETTLFTERFACICFDAFSSNSSPDLWSASFLTSFLSNACTEQAILSTYACTGNLKRTLKTLGFAILPKNGFSGKRESTLAIRNSG